MKQLLSILSSMKTMAVLMLIFAFVIGYATFIENDYGTITAKADIYNAKWFETLLALLTINLILNIFNFKMYKLKKAPIFIFHIAFIVIIFGAAITRYVGFEGSMHIREGRSESTMTSASTYFNVDAKVGDKSALTSEAVYLSKKSSNSLNSSLVVDGKKIDVELVEYIPDAVETIVEDKENGFGVVNMMVAGNGAGKQLSLKEGEFYETNDVILDFNSKKDLVTKGKHKPIISIYFKDKKLFMKHDKSIKYLKMDDRSTGELSPSDTEEFVTRTLFTVGTSSFVVRNYLAHASTKIVSNPNASVMNPGYDALRFKITVDGVSKESLIFGKPGILAKDYHDEVNGVDVHLSYGSIELQLPFEIQLKDFQLDRYPGSMSPASYASEVILIDKEQNLNMPYRIYMNNILEHRGYRFFQASYDQDEGGTILSVNNDPGTLPSYIGYFLLALGMFWSLFSKGNRFANLSAKAKKASEKNALSILVAFGILTSITPAYATELDPIVKTIISFDKEHANKFGELIVQDNGGRMKPMDTMTTEILAKIHSSSSVNIGEYSLNANQVVLGMMVRPDAYKDLKIIKTKNEEINKIIGAKLDARYASFSQFFADPQNMRGYKLAELVDSAVRKEPKYRDKLDKEIIKLDERVNVTYMVYTSSLIKMWPKQHDTNNKWFTSVESIQTFSHDDATKVQNIIVEYYTSVDNALASGEWNDATKVLGKIVEYQKFYGAEVYPSQNRISAEVFYNEAKIFERLYPLYMLVGFMLLILSFIKILSPSFKIDKYTKATLWLLIVFFIAHTIGLANRWYISGHAPWSDGYESMIYIAWATVLAGFIFSKRSSMTMASTGILAGLILFVAHLNWMNPQVTNLVPVLNSYWLSIHVSMITASYGFLGLGALLGFITIILFALKNPSNEKHISLSIKELNAINEMSLMVGLVLLTVGNFLGGVWANESWGRYWGWDPKETWALVTILVYAVVVHIRFIKSIYSDFSFSVISLLSFTSVLMTYFGVNYYLKGLHSYAKGDAVPIPDFVPITYFIVFLMIALAFRNRKLA